MANAHPDVIATATDLAPANHDDGVAVVLGRIFDL
jgi:hydroxymethylpyrimidine pyrophosphatase-like HAD family hydrolase